VIQHRWLKGWLVKLFGSRPAECRLMRDELLSFEAIAVIPPADRQPSRAGGPS
jgi:hypothetical protein